MMDNGLWVMAWFVLAVLCDLVYYITKLASNDRKGVGGYAFFAVVFFGLAVAQQFGWLA